MDLTLKRVLEHLNIIALAPEPVRPFLSTLLWIGVALCLLSLILKKIFSPEYRELYKVITTITSFSIKTYAIAVREAAKRWEELPSIPSLPTTTELFLGIIGVAVFVSYFAVVFLVTGWIAVQFLSNVGDLLGAAFACIFLFFPVLCLRAVWGGLIELGVLLKTYRATKSRHPKTIEH